MKITNQQKSVIAICTGLIIILSATTIFNRPDFSNQAKQDNALAEQLRREQEEYEAYLASTKTDPEASKKLLEKLIKEEDVKEEVFATLDVNRPVVEPVIADSDIKITNESSQASLVRYFSELNSLADTISADNAAVQSDLFSDEGDVALVQNVASKTDQVITQVRGMQVPRDAVAFHKRELVVLGEYRDTLAQAQKGTAGTEADWAEIYNSYKIANKSFPVLFEEAKRLDEKYALHEAFAKIAAKGDGGAGVLGIKTADAFTTGTIIVADVPRKIEFTYRTALSIAFASFTTTFIRTLIGRLENTYRISNFLYYTDALVQGRYTDDYLTKYITNPKDRDIVKQLIPEIGCFNTDPRLLKAAFKQKAKEHLGYDPSIVKPSDADYTEKMVKIGSVFGRPDGLGWEIYLEDVAAQTRAEAKNAALLEQLSPGIKTSRVQNQINRSLTSIEKSIQSAFQALFDTGTGNTSDPATQIVAKVLSSFLSNFVLNGTVFVEQEVCFNSVQKNPIVPSSGSGSGGSEPTDTPPPIFP